MSGHSKWAKIKRDKTSNDAKRGAIFTKLGNQIAVAARQGSDPNTNAPLALAIDTAKSFNMPKTTIDRAIKRAADKASAAVEEIVYEGYGQGGVAILVEAATDNRKRTYPEVKTAFAKHGGRIAEVGSVIFNFQHAGEILVNQLSDTETLQLLEAGAEDIITGDGIVSVLTKATDFHHVLESLKRLKITPEHAGLVYRPKVVVDVDNSQRSKLDKLIEALEALPDTLNVYTNLADENRS